MADGTSAESAVSVNSPSSSIASPSPSALSSSLTTHMEAMASFGKDVVSGRALNYPNATDESEVDAESDVGSSRVHSEMEESSQVCSTDGEIPRELSGGDSDPDATAKDPTTLDRIQHETGVLGALIREKALELALSHRFDQVSFVTRSPARRARAWSGVAALEPDRPSFYPTPRCSGPPNTSCPLC